MDAAAQAAAEINTMWTACIPSGVSVECPSNEQVAEIIRKYLQADADRK